MEDAIDRSLDVILTVDYDTVFTLQDVLGLLEILDNNEHVDAIATVQSGRGGLRPLMTQKQPSGAPKNVLERKELMQPIMPVATAHFGLTLIRTRALLKMSHPWFQGEPDRDGRWGRDRIDPDIWFWRKWQDTGNALYMANRIVIGHSEGGVILWPDKQFNTHFQLQKDYHDNGKPPEAWE